MTDKERVLMNIAVDTGGGVCDRIVNIEGGWSLRCSLDNPTPQFVLTNVADAIKMPLESGDIVRCETNSSHRWGIAEFVRQIGYSHFLLREIGGEAICNMKNERLSVLRFMDRSRLYTGTKYRVLKFAHKAFLKRYNANADHSKRFGGIAFDGKIVNIWCRAHVWAAERCSEGIVEYAQPKKFTLEWSNKTRLKDIVSAMREQGFVHDFEYAQTNPAEAGIGIGMTRKTKKLVGKVTANL